MEAPKRRRLANQANNQRAWVVGVTADINDHYKLGRTVGKGAFGNAKVATHIGTGEERVVKVVSKSALGRMPQATLEALKNEIKILKKLDHPHVVKHFETFETPYTLYIVMEYCRGGELFDRISAMQRYGEKEAWSVAKQMFEAVRHMHSLNVAHFDIKPENIMFLTNQPDSPLRIIDFGYSRFAKSRKEGKYFSSTAGTVVYSSPEVLQGCYDKPSDMWSLGVVLFVMLFGFPPFVDHPRNRDQVIRRKVMRGFTPKVQPGYGPWFPQAMPISDGAKELIGRLLTLDPAKRLTAQEALEHGWLESGLNVPQGPLPTSVRKGMSEFSGVCLFRKMILQTLSKTVEQADIATVQKAFKSIDLNEDGVISLEELKQALRHPSWADEGHQSETALRILESLDIDKDGHIGYEELLMSFLHRQLLAKEERMWRTFKRLDLNGDGVLSAEELQAACGTDYKVAQAIIREVDLDGDGNISYNEFLAKWMDSQEADVHEIFNRLETPAKAEQREIAEMERGVSLKPPPLKKVTRGASLEEFLNHNRKRHMSDR